MAKKNFDSGINAILRKTSKDNRKDIATGIRTSVILGNESLESLRALAFWNRTTLKNVIESAVEDYLSRVDRGSLEKAICEYRSHQRQEAD